MAADNKFIKAGYGTATTLSAPGYTSGVSTTINVASTATWPTTTDVIFAIDEAEVVDGEEVRVDGTYNVFQGTVDTATSIIDVDYIGGDAERSYSAGALTRVYILSSSYLWNRLIDALLVSLDQDGTLKAGAVDVAGVLASNVVTTAKILDANVTNAKLATGAGEPGGAWTSYTPTFANTTLGNGSVAGAYTQIGKTVHFRAVFTLGSTSAMGTNPTVTLPVTSATTAGSMNVFISDTGTAFYGGFTAYSTTSILQIYVFNTGTPYARLDGPSSTVPMTWANTDILTITGTYQAA